MIPRVAWILRFHAQSLYIPFLESVITDTDDLKMEKRTKETKVVALHFFFPTAGRASIPIRCLVERQEAVDLKSLTSDTGSSSGPSPDTARKSPSTTSPPCVTSSLEQDSFAIIPSSIPFVDLVKAALIKLGYSSSEAVGAKGLLPKFLLRMHHDRR